MLTLKSMHWFLFPFWLLWHTVPILVLWKQNFVTRARQVKSIHQMKRKLNVLHLQAKFGCHPRKLIESHYGGDTFLETKKQDKQKVTQVPLISWEYGSTERHRCRVLCRYKWNCWTQKRCHLELCCIYSTTQIVPKKDFRFLPLLFPISIAQRAQKKNTKSKACNVSGFFLQDHCFLLRRPPNKAGLTGPNIPQDVSKTCWVHSVRPRNALSPDPSRLQRRHKQSKLQVEQGSFLHLWQGSHTTLLTTFHNFSRRQKPISGQFFKMLVISHSFRSIFIDDW